MHTLAPPLGAPWIAAWIGTLAGPWGARLFPTPASPGQEHGAVAEAPAAASWGGVDPAPDAAGACRYWPCERLNAFILQMAAQGHCVNAAMMLGHRPYAEQQLNKACAEGDASLRALAAELQAYFNLPPGNAALQLARQQESRGPHQARESDKRTAESRH